MQNIQVIGRIVRDAEQKLIGEGNKSVFTVVTANGRRKDEEPIYYEVMVGGVLSEALHKYLLRGVQVFVESEKLRVNQWQSIDGVNRVSLGLFASRIELLGRPQKIVNEEQPTTTTEPNDLSF